MEKTSKPKTPHAITLLNRSDMTLSGVSDVVSFTDSEITLKTNCGGMVIKGDSLNIGKLNTDTGEVCITGTVTLMKYTKAANNGGVLEGLFK